MRIRRPSIVALAALVASLLVAPSAIADELDEAKKVEAAARKAFEAKDYEAAAKAFARANAMAPRAATKYNEAFAWGKADNVAAAADAYEAALELGLEGKLAKAANDRIVELKRELGYLVVPGPPGTTR